jgi:Zn-finger nucleic acid-binding protein
MLTCPRDGADLTKENFRKIAVDHCPQCNGRWLDFAELDQLEATAAPDADTRRATIEYSQRAGELKCPACGKTMVTFNYRAYDLELDTCEEQHGFWLDAGEEGRVRDIMEERVRGLERSASAEESWAKFIGRIGHRSVLDNIKGMFAGRRR